MVALCGYTKQVYSITRDHIPALTFTLRDNEDPVYGRTLDPSDYQTWKPMDLTHTTVMMFFRKMGANRDEVIRTFAVLKHAPFTSGKCTIHWTPGSQMDIAPGYYEGEIQTVHRPSGYIQSAWERFRFLYREEFDGPNTPDPELGYLL